MPAMTKFRFDTRFETEPPPEPSAPEPEAPPEAVLTKADLEAAREEGFAAGREAGLADATAIAEQARAEALAGVARQLGEFGPRIDEALAAFRKDAIDVARAIVRKAVGVAARETALASVEHMITSFMPRLLDEPRIVVRVNDTLLDPLKGAAQPLADGCGYRGSIILLADPDLAPADCRIEWADGGANRNSERLWSEIDSAVESFLSGTAGDMPAPAAPDEELNAEEKPHG